MKKDIGKILMTYEGEYDNTRTYEPLCIVSYNKFKWISKKQTTGNPPSEEDTINWKLFMDDISADDLFSGNYDDLSNKPTNATIKKDGFMSVNDKKKLEKYSADGDTKDLTVTYTSQDTTNVTTWSDVDVLSSGEKHQSIFSKISTMFKNVRYLYKMLGTADISTLGEGADIGTVTGALSKLNSDKADKSNITPAILLSDSVISFKTLPIKLNEHGMQLIIYDGAISLSNYLKPSNDDLYLGYVLNGYPREYTAIPLQAMLITESGYITQKCVCYLRSDGGMYLSIPKELKSDCFNWVCINGVSVGQIL